MAEAKEEKAGKQNRGTKPEGRPPMFKDKEELQKKVDQYFESIEPQFGTNEEGEVEMTKKGEPATITGLALFLGFESRQSIYDYQSSGEFAYTIARARLRVELAYEKALIEIRNPSGAIFALKNMNWSDRTEHELTGKGGETIQIKMDLSRG